MPVTATKVPPVPVNLVQVPPACSPIMSVARLIAAPLLSQVLIPPSLPALTGLLITITIWLLVAGLPETQPRFEVIIPK